MGYLRADEKQTSKFSIYDWWRFLQSIGVVHPLRYVNNSTIIPNTFTQLANIEISKVEVLFDDLPFPKVQDFKIHSQVSQKAVLAKFQQSTICYNSRNLWLTTLQLSTLQVESPLHNFANYKVKTSGPMLNCVFSSRNGVF